MKQVFKTAKYNGISLEPYFKITKVYIPPTADITNVTKSIATRGLSFKRQKRGSKVIKIDILIDKDIDDRIDELNAIFATYPAKLELSHLPDRYYNVALSKFGTPSSTVDNAELTLEFESFDGVAHSSTYKLFNTPSVSGKELTFDLDNKGNEVAFPIIKIKHNSENGYIGLVNQTAAMELGNREEIDGKVVEKSVMAFDYRGDKLFGSSTAGFDVAIKNKQINYYYSDGMGGSFVGKQVWGRNHLYLSNYPKNYVYGTASMTWPVNDATLYDRLWWRQVFLPDKTEERGFMSVIVTDADGSVIYGTTTMKNRAGRSAYYSLFVGDGRGGYRVLANIDFTATDLDKDNPFNHPRGYSEIVRNDEKVSFYWFGIHKPYNIPEIKGKKAANVTVIMGAFSDLKPITHMYLDDIFFTKNKVSSWEDIRNRYTNGTTVEINSENKNVIIDGILSAHEVVDGSDFIKLPPGKSQLKVYASDWVTQTPTVTVEFEERWS